MDIIIRKLQTIAEFLEAEELQQVVWNRPDGLDVIPLHTQVAIQKNGGLVLGGFTPQGEMAAYLLGFLGRHSDGRIKHCSQQLGVLPKYRGQGIGTRMKLAQREEVLKQGLDLITWTYDPLEGPNARLNITHLGATCSTYLREPYGEMGDDLNRGVAADRFEVTWWITSERVARRVAALTERTHRHPVTLTPLPFANRVHRTESGFSAPDEWNLPGSDRFLVQVPTDFQAIKRADHELAVAWREHTRALFEAAFASGYEVRDFYSVVEGGQQRNVYLLVEVSGDYASR